MDCTKWLKEYPQMSGGEARFDHTRIAAWDEGFTNAELRVARRKLGVVTRRDVCADTWWWALPEQVD
ncbi:MAG: hypothetical protein FWF10_00550 [Clostridiales bacterium]|nr:hypothetical protein [Clostridiales bacterium]